MAQLTHCSSAEAELQIAGQVFGVIKSVPDIACITSIIWLLDSLKDAKHDPICSVVSLALSTGTQAETCSGADVCVLFTAGLSDSAHSVPGRYGDEVVVDIKGGRDPDRGQRQQSGSASTSGYHMPLLRGQCSSTVSRVMIVASCCCVATMSGRQRLQQTAYMLTMLSALPSAHADVTVCLDGGWLCGHYNTTEYSLCGASGMYVLHHLSSLHSISPGEIEARGWHR